MTDKRFTQEEVRADADDLRNAGHPTTADMLTAYATLLEQIERAKAGVTDEVTEQAFQAACAAMGGYRTRLCRKSVLAALQAVAHLLPSDEHEVAVARVQRGGDGQLYAMLLPGADTKVREGMVLAIAHLLPNGECGEVNHIGELLAVIHGDGGHYQAEHGVQKAAKDALQKVIEMMTKIATNSPVQVAQVNADGLIDAYDEATGRQRNSGFLPEAAQRTAHECVEHNRNRLRKAILAAPTAEPVAQGEVADKHERELLSLIDERDRREEIIDCLCDAVLGQGWPEWSSAYGYDDALLEVQEAMFAQPRMPDGWMLVPREPTPKMVEACIAGWQERVRRKAENGTLLSGGNAGQSFRENYAVMIAAAPQPGESS